MDAPAFRERVETAKRTELDRLGSNKLLVALTGADLSRGAVLETAAASEHAARETFRAWAADEEHADAREAFEAAADREADHLDRVVAAMDDAFDPPEDPGPMHAYLRGRTATTARLGGMVGRGLVSDRTHAQLVGFFVNEADERRADLFRELKDETAAALADALDLLETCCVDDEDWTSARSSAEYVVQLAYDDYADALAGMGVDPKPVC